MIVGDGLARPVLYNGARMLVTDGEHRREGNEKRQGKIGSSFTNMWTNNDIVWCP